MQDSDNLYRTRHMHKLIETLLAGAPVITDGAWGTELQARGLPIGEFPDAWNLSHPERVAAVARAYVEAGSQVILTNTFGANRIRLSEAGLEDKVVQVNRAGVEISRRAAIQRSYVFASMGPSGKLLANGDATPDQLRLAFDEQAQALAAAGADALVIETMSDLDETVVALAAARATGLPVVACMVFDSGKNKDRTMMGNSPEEAARTLSEAGADVIGANCGRGIAGFTGICGQLRAATDRPIWLKPNAGLPQLINGRAIYHTTPGEFADFAPALIRSGASFIGGCCGTRPDFIRALNLLLKNCPGEGAGPS
jgi:5-methyltetrahydrofolate--homocysteine methyltransferase